MLYTIYTYIDTDTYTYEHIKQRKKVVKEKNPAKLLKNHVYANAFYSN